MPDSPRTYVIAVMSRDRIGIIAEVAGALSALGGDIADSRQSVLCGYFTMLLLARFPAGVTGAAIEQAIQAASHASPYGRGAPRLEVIVRQADPAALAEAAAPGTMPTGTMPTGTGHRYLLTARGPDRVGFVAAVSAFCSANGLNILDLSTTVFGGDYIMMLLVDVSRCGDLDDLRRRLKAFGEQAGLSAVLQHEAIFRATNEVDA